jgi:hypothetical protein
MLFLLFELDDAEGPRRKSSDVRVGAACVWVQHDRVHIYISMNVHMELWMDESTMACLVSTTNITNHIHYY